MGARCRLTSDEADMDLALLGHAAYPWCVILLWCVIASSTLPRRLHCLNSCMSRISTGPIQLRISLAEITPPIWRRVLVSPDTSLDQLRPHDV